MAEKANSSVRFDDFVGRVHADPANVEPRILLSGFVGRSEDEGKLRIYSDPGLGSWVEAATDDVVHAQPISDSPLGGSHVWLKSSAALTPGSAQGAGGAAAAAAAPVGGLGVDTGVFNPTLTIHPTLWTQLCPTHYRCPPISLATVCTHYSPCVVHTREFICPPVTLRIDQCGGPIHTVICPPPHTLICPISQTCPTHSPVTCPVATGFTCPDTIGCPIGGPIEQPQVHAFAAAAAPTQLLGCPGSSTCTPPTHMLGCPGTSTCTPPTLMLGCPNTSTCTPTHSPACAATIPPPSATPACYPPTHMLGCPPTRTCPPTHMLGCPPTSTCPPTHSPACAATIPPSSTPGCLPPTLYGCGHQMPTLPPGCPSPTMLGCLPTHIPGCGGGGIHTVVGCFPTIPGTCPPTTPPFCPATIGCQG
jgi:hypothetical protein